MHIQHHQGKQQRQVEHGRLQQLAGSLLRAGRVRGHFERGQPQADIKQAYTQNPARYAVSGPTRLIHAVPISIAATPTTASDSLLQSAAEPRGDGGGGEGGRRDRQEGQAGL